MTLAFVINPKNRGPSQKENNISQTDLGSVEENLQTTHKDTQSNLEEEDGFNLKNLIRPMTIEEKGEEEIMTHKRISQMNNINDFRLLALKNLKYDNENVVPENASKSARESSKQEVQEEIEMITRKRSIYYIKHDDNSNSDSLNNPLNVFLKYQSKLKSYDQKIQ